MNPPCDLDRPGDAAPKADSIACLGFGLAAMLTSVFWPVGVPIAIIGLVLGRRAGLEWAHAWARAGFGMSVIALGLNLGLIGLIAVLGRGGFGFLD